MKSVDRIDATKHIRVVGMSESEVISMFDAIVPSVIPSKFILSTAAPISEPSSFECWMSVLCPEDNISPTNITIPGVMIPELNDSNYNSSNTVYIPQATITDTVTTSYRYSPRYHMMVPPPC